MQPHTNLGINFRKRFEPLGWSKVRGLRAVNGRLEDLLVSINKGELKREDVKEQIKDYRKKIKEIKKRRR